MNLTGFRERPMFCSIEIFGPLWMRTVPWYLTYFYLHCCHYFGCLPLSQLLEDDGDTNAKAYSSNGNIIEIKEIFTANSKTVAKKE